MKPDHGAPSGLLPARGPARPLVPVLIQVPALHPSASARVVGRTRPARRRRRLRREVRMVGSAMLIGMTTTLGLLPMWGGRVPGRALAASAEVGARPEPAAEGPGPADRDPVVSLSSAIEPAGTRDGGHPVVQLGIIVPDDGVEEAPHGRN